MHSVETAMKSWAIRTTPPEWLADLYFRMAQCQKLKITQLEADIEQLNCQHEEDSLQIQAQQILLLLSNEAPVAWSTQENFWKGVRVAPRNTPKKFS